VEIVSIEFIGADSAQFSEDASNPWPALPTLVRPGDVLNLSVVLTPTGTPGPRTAMLRITLSNGEVIDIPLRGEAGVQTLVVAPTDLFNGASVNVGSEIRAKVTITNTGTLPLVLNQPVLAGTDPGNYIVAKLVRVVLDPGQTEFLEVTFAPQAAGASSATLTIGSNAGSQDVTLGGEGARAKKDDDESTRISTGGSDPLEPVLSEREDRHQGISRVEDQLRGLGLSSVEVSPNPTSVQSEVRWTLTKSTSVEVSVYDASGRKVMDLYSGQSSAGEHRAMVDVSSLTAGSYLVRIDLGGVSTVRRLVVVR
jgi:hypothetical protein